MRLTDKLKPVAQENGFASLVIAAILVVVLGLLTVGFAELMRHSQQQELNNHLSNQAYYAAESGVNDAVRALQNGYDGTKSTCGPTTDPSAADYSKYLADNDATQGSGSISAEWTCLLINPTPNSLQFNPVDTVTPSTFIFEPVNSSGTFDPLSNLTIYWQAASKNDAPYFIGSSARSCGNSCFPTAARWGSSAGMLHFSATPLNNLDRQSLINGTYSSFFYPSSASSNTDTYSATGLSAATGKIIDGGCNANNLPLYCSVTLSGLPTSNEFMISLRSIYSPTNVEIVGKDSSGNVVDFAGAQTLVDSTGKSQNVLRRIQVRVPDQRQFPFPGFDAEATQGICKQLSAYPGPPVSLSC